MGRIQRLMPRKKHLRIGIEFLEDGTIHYQIVGHRLLFARNDAAWFILLIDDRVDRMIFRTG